MESLVTLITVSICIFTSIAVSAAIMVGKRS